MNKKAVTIAISFLLLLSGMLFVIESESTVEQNVEVKSENGAFFDPEIIDYTEEIELGDEIWIKYSVTNTGDAEGTQDIILTVKVEEVDIEEEKRHENVTLGPGDNETYEYEYDTKEIEEEYGQDIIEVEVEVKVTLETDNDSDSAKSTVTSSGMIPGFTFNLLPLGVIFAVVIYHTKKR